MAIDINDLKKMPAKAKVLAVLILILLIGYLDWFYFLSSAMEKQSSLTGQVKELQEKIKEKEKVEPVVTLVQIQCPTCDSKFARRFKVCPKCGSAYTFCINKTCLEPLPIGSAICPSCSTNQKEEITDSAKSAELTGSRQIDISKSNERELRDISANKNIIDPGTTSVWSLPNKN